LPAAPFLINGTRGPMNSAHPAAPAAAADPLKTRQQEEGRMIATDRDSALPEAKKLSYANLEFARCVRRINAARLPFEFKTELLDIIEKHGSLPSCVRGTNVQPVDATTQYERTLSLVAGFVELRDDGFLLTSPYVLEAIHMHHLVRRWVAAGQRAGTVENKLSRWRAFASWIGKGTLVQPLAHYIDAATGYRRIYGDPDSTKSYRVAVSRDTLMQALSASNGSRRKAARALGVSKSLMHRSLVLAGLCASQPAPVRERVPFDRLTEAMRQAKGNRTHAARALGISKTSLYRLLEELRLEDSMRSDAAQA
jgi:hypothetical protein